MKGAIIPITACLCFISIMIAANYEEYIDSQRDKELAKAGLEQCQTSSMSQVIWVKSCTEYINARKEK